MPWDAELTVKGHTEHCLAREGMGYPCDCGRGWAEANKFMRQIEEIPKKLLDECGMTVIDKICKGPVDLSWYVGQRLNSFERDAIVPFMTDELLAHHAQHSLHNSSHRRTPCLTYDESVQMCCEELLRCFKLVPSRIVHAQRSGFMSGVMTMAFIAAVGFCCGAFAIWFKEWTR